MVAKVYHFDRMAIMEDLSLFAREICKDFERELEQRDCEYDEDELFLFAEYQMDWAGLKGWKREYVFKRLEAYLEL